MTLIDYAITFEFQKSSYNIFARSVTDIISTLTLTSFVNQTRKKQIGLLRKINPTSNTKNIKSDTKFIKIN